MGTSGLHLASRQRKSKAAPVTDIRRTMRPAHGDGPRTHWTDPALPPRSVRWRAPESADRGVLDTEGHARLPLPPVELDRAGQMQRRAASLQERAPERLIE
jgi:hypothetical protein